MVSVDIHSKLVPGFVSRFSYHGWQMVILEINLHNRTTTDE